MVDVAWTVALWQAEITSAVGADGDRQHFSQRLLGEQGARPAVPGKLWTAFLYDSALLR
jgi:hypothetical protein